MNTPRPWHRPVVTGLADRAYLLLPLTQLFWAGNFVVGRAARADMPPVTLAFCRWTIAFLLVLPLAWPYLRRDLPLMKRHWRIMLLLAATGVAAFNTLVYTGLQSTTALNALLLQSTMPLIIIACSFAMFGDRIGAPQAVGLAVSLLGVGWIITAGDVSAILRLEFNHGDLWVFAAVMSYAVYATLLRRRPAVDAASFIAATFALGALMLLPFLAWEYSAGHVPRLSPMGMVAIGYVGLFPSVVAYFCWNRGVELIGANAAGQFIHLMPVFGSLLATTLLSEPFHGYHLAGGVLIIAGILCANRTRG